MTLARRFWLSIMVGVSMASGSVQAEPAGRITGLGGLFVHSKDPKALAAWYRDVLGVPVESWGGAMLRYDAPGHPDVLVWTPFRKAATISRPRPANS
jgi:hypothetical protein